MEHSNRKCCHPLFQWASEGVWNGAPEGLRQPCVFVFERPRWRTPTPEAIASYRAAEQTVQHLGGSMNKREWEIAGEAAPLSGAEVQAIVACVEKCNPGATVIQHWNGEGCYSVSVGVELAPARSGARTDAASTPKA